MTRFYVPSSDEVLGAMQAFEDSYGGKVMAPVSAPEIGRRVRRPAGMSVSALKLRVVINQMVELGQLVARTGEQWRDHSGNFLYMSSRNTYFLTPQQSQRRHKEHVDRVEQFRVKALTKRAQKILAAEHQTRFQDLIDHMTAYPEWRHESEE